MYTSFKVKNFRCFKDLELGDLARINLIAGKNNVGKTALLEAFWIHQGGNNATLGLKIDAFRGIHEFNSQELLRDLFREFDSSRKIELSSYDDAGNTRRTIITECEQRITQFPLSENNENMTPEQETSSQLSEPLSSGIAFNYIDESGKGYEASMYLVEGNGKMRVQFDRASFPKRPVGTFLAAQSRTDPAVNAERFGNLRITKEQGEMVRILREIEPRLQSLDVIPRGGKPIVHGDIGLDRLVPLPLLGEGTNRLLSYSLAIAHAADGIVLIDEIENGLHYMVRADVWKAIAALARRYNVQVFSTTHSEGCIRVAHRAFVEDGQYDFRLHRLDRVADTIEAVTYDQETLAVALEDGLEVR